MDRGKRGAPKGCKGAALHPAPPLWERGQRRGPWGLPGTLGGWESQCLKSRGRELGLIRLQG